MPLQKPPCFTLAARDAGHLTLVSDRGDAAHVFVLEPDIIRILLLPRGTLNHTKTFAIAPGAEDVALEGRDRFDLASFAQPEFSAVADAENLRIETTAIRLDVRLNGFFCSWALRLGTEWRSIARDRPTQAYNFSWWDERVYHYLVREHGEMYFGLGERAGAMNRAGGRYRLTNIDAMGYDARTSDPLYKHIPFYLTCRPESGAAFGLFYDTLSDCTFDFGKELDNYHGPYRYFAADHGDLDYYFIAGPSVAEATRRFTWLTGRPAFTPRWGLGYSGSSMAYTDAPDAAERLSQFLENCAEHDILCDSFHLSSGYTSIGDKRHVFNWNRSKFPDPAAFTRAFAEKGVRLCANVKPCLMPENPLFEEARALGLFIEDGGGSPSFSQFWAGLGAYLDFTNPATIRWWQRKIDEALLDYGVAAIWNDNNEFEILSPTALAQNFGKSRPAYEMKPLQSLLMMRASRDAQKRRAANLRPFVVSRSGGVGMHRYVQTWSGDNNTSWETLRYNLKMGLGLSLSGVSNSGHDIGGFSGPAPDPELFVRFVQFGVFLPRFSIHSWNDNGTVNEPWMHPEATPYVRANIKLRYRLIPYLYDLLWRYHHDYEPILRPTFFDFPDDPRCWTENDEMMVGRALLAAPVVEPGCAEREIYLPAGTRWYDYWAGEIFAGGQTVTRPALWSQPVLFVREGSAIAVNVAEQSFAKRADRRGFMIFPPRGSGAFTVENFEDDGESEAYRSAHAGGWRIEVEADASCISARVEHFGASDLRDERPWLIFPQTEARRVSISYSGSL
jgi:alpha-glucosidase